jgi:enterobactin C-glucosyltransferase
VLVATTGPALEGTGRACLAGVDVRPDFDFAGVGGAVRERGPAVGPVFSDPAMAADQVVVARLYAGWSDQLADGTIETARAWRPDLVVYSSGCAAGPLAAAAVCVPSVLHGIGLRLGGRLTGLVLEELRPAYERLALAGAPVPPAALLDNCPPSLREPGRQAGWTVRAVPFNGGGALPDWLPAPASRPRVCVTLGTVVGRLMGVGGLAGVVEAAGELDADVVLALGDFDLTALGMLPANVRTTGWVPLG